MTEAPTTEAGRSVPFDFDSNGDEWGYVTRADILAIEAQARTDFARELAERFRLMPWQEDPTLVFVLGILGWEADR